MGKREVIASILGKHNKSITKLRVKLLNAIELMLKDKTHIFGKGSRPSVTDEEECVRVFAKSCTKNIVTLKDGTEMDLGDIGTDDLHSIVDQVHSDLYIIS